LPRIAAAHRGRRQSSDRVVSGLAERLGIERALILHVDDLAMCHGANRAYLELAAAGLVTCGSVMVPCPWFREIAEAAADPKLDLGVHLTLTSEWPHYRWRPLSTTSRASGLIDDDGYFWRDVASLWPHLVPEAAEAELRAQIDCAIASGMRPTHIDAHMAAAMLPELIELHVRLAEDYGVVPVLPRAIRWAPERASYVETVARLDAAGRPVIDHFRGTQPVEAEATARRYREAIESLPPGVAHFALHATIPGEIETIAPQHAGWRTREFALFRSGTVAEWCAELEITTVGYREIQLLWRENAD
jgi:predicted glycoside hydrolase/deacetylase ChbG (UPF0249 family)